jgi:hypothetical protein
MVEPRIQLGSLRDMNKKKGRRGEERFTIRCGTPGLGKLISLSFYLLKNSPSLLLLFNNQKR